MADLFYNMTSKTVGLVGMWDCVAFDEVASITFKDKDGVQIIQGGGKLIPAGIANPSTIFTMSHAKLHTAAASGRWCGAERPRCGLSNSRH